MTRGEKNLKLIINKNKNFFFYNFFKRSWILTLKKSLASLGAPTGLVGLHQGLVYVLVGGAGVPIRLLPLVHLLSDGMQGIIDSCHRSVGQLHCSLGVVNLLTRICSHNINRQRRAPPHTLKLCARCFRTRGEVEVLLNRLQRLHHIQPFGFGGVQPLLSVFQLWPHV